MIHHWFNRRVGAKVLKIDNVPVARAPRNALSQSGSLLMMGLIGEFFVQNVHGFLVEHKPRDRRTTYIG